MPATFGLEFNISLYYTLLLYYLWSCRSWSKSPGGQPTDADILKAWRRMRNPTPSVDASPIYSKNNSANFILIRFETTEPWALLSVSPQEKEQEDE